MSSLYDSLKFPTRKDFKNLLGKRLGRLFVLAYAGKKGSKNYWKCVCDCGDMTFPCHCDLQSGSTRSCGCLAAEVKRKCKVSHGETKGRTNPFEYRVWINMRSRCRAKSGQSYRNYTKRGITVCERWNKYENFLEDMGRSPSPDHSIDRIDNNLGYFPENCRWATLEEQANNKRNTIFLSLNGVRKCVSDWARDLELSPGLIKGRLLSGWSDKDALTTPVRRAKLFEHKGEKRKISEWSTITGVSEAVLNYRVKRKGWSLEKAINTPVIKTRPRKDLPE